MNDKIAQTPEYYTPLFDPDSDTFMDLIPSNGQKFQQKFPNGLECCNGHVFANRNSFASHIKTKGHIHWLQELRMENKNYHSKIITLEKTVKNQQMIITSLSNQLERYKVNVPCADLLSL
jgi:hypothetical protein